jgi:hypothetical protein
MGITHTNIFTGKIKKVRTQATAPTDPTPERGDMYVDNTVGAYALGIYNGNGWIFISLAV